jgi:transmembrane sensor
MDSSVSPPRTDGPPIAAPIVEQAVAWYVRLASGEAGAQDRAGFERWLGADGEHGRAWRRLQGINGQVAGGTAALEPAVTRATLARAAQAVPSRRRAIKSLVWAGVGGGALYVAQRQLPWRAELAAAMADERTRSGERRELLLPDGTRLTLNTGTAVDIRFDARQRQVLLRHGEILVATASDPTGRPFAVHTREGSLEPLGTRFTVRRDEAVADGDVAETRLAVSEGAVAVRPAARADVAPVRVSAGQQVRFTRDRVDAIEALSEATQSWTDGVLTAERQTLGEFIAELDRYRPGRLRCDPEVAGLRLTGAWPLQGGEGDPTDRILASLERQLPVRVHRLTRYWVTVAAR